MTKITPEHLARGAYIYVRQSTADQVLNNHESRRRQYGLADRARALGWTTVEVIDDDLGRSGSGIARPGFEKLLAAICEGRVGVVVSIEASRLARNGRDWHTLLEFCGLVGTLIADEDGVYDPRHPNDRLLLGMKGTMSEMELSLFRQRSLEALKQKARRGELLFTVAIGYVKAPNDRLEKDPDRRVQEAIALVFSKFAGTADGTASASVDAPGTAAIASGGIRRGRPAHHLEVASLQHIASHADQPGLCWRLRFRAHRKSRHDRGRSQAHRAGLPQGARGVGGFDSPPPRGLHRLGRVRKKPASDQRQRQWQKFHEPRIGTAWRGIAGRPAALWPLRPQAARRLQWCERRRRALPLPWRASKSWRRSVHLVRRDAH